MAAKSSSYVYEKSFSDFHGVDFSRDASELGDNELAFAVNMYRDREGGGGGIESFPGYRKIATVGNKIHAIHRHPKERDTLLLHGGRSLYTYSIAARGTSTVSPVKVKNALLADRESQAAAEGEALYLTDGTSYSVYRGDALSYAHTNAYIPVARSDGADYEQVNLLTDRGREEYHLYDLNAHAYHTTEGIVCTVDGDGVCLVSGYTGEDSRIVLPTEMTVGERTYAVTGVASGAFYENAVIKELVVPEGYTHLGVGALSDMPSLRTLVLPSTLREIPGYCLKNDTLLHLYLAEGIPKCNESALYNATVYTIDYTGDALSLMQMEGYDVLLSHIQPSGRTMRYYTRYEPITCQFFMKETVCEMTAATLNGTLLSAYGDITCIAHTVEDAALGARVDYIVLSAPNEAALFGKTISLSLRYADVLAEELRTRYPDFGGTGRDAVNGCRLIARFDGRFFLSGNEALPGVVFYTARRPTGAHEPTHIGRYNYFIDGDGATEIRALLPTATHLLVLTATPSSGPTVFRHTAVDTGDDLLPRIYPVSDALGDRGCLGATLLFLDDPLYLSEGGLEAVESVTSALSTEKRLSHRSAPVDVRLCREALSTARLFRFGSYIGIATESGNIYLGDGYERMRGNRSAPYEWYCLCDVGEYEGQVRRYRYASVPLPTALLGASVPMTDAPALPIREPTERGAAVDGMTVYSATVNGYAFTYVSVDGAALPVENDGEFYGGEFRSISAILEVDGLLFFATDTGSLFVVNTDKREADGHIPQMYYTFNGRAYPMAIATRSDDGGMPTLRKSTVRGGAVRMKAMAGSRVRVLASVDGGPFRPADTLYCGRLLFSEIDFASVSHADVQECVLPLRAGAKRYAELQLMLTSEEYQRPFGIISLAYRYRAAGRI